MYKGNSYDLLLHEEVYMPTEVIKTALLLQKSIKNQYSRHLLMDRLANTDYKHNYTDEDLQKAIERLRENPIKPFEVGLNKYGGKLYLDKQCVRLSYDNFVDICIVVSGNGIVITAWLNDKMDTHKTLNKWRYNTKEEYERILK